MAKNVPGAMFIDSKGIKYILAYGPKGNLRPYTIGLVKVLTKTRNPCIIVVITAAVAAVIVFRAWKKFYHKKFAST